MISTDKHPIFFDRNGIPLSFGKLRYTAPRSATQPKSVYQDISRLNPFPSNELILDGNGRSVGQVFLGAGDYVVTTFKFFGDDPTNPNQDEYALDNQWVESADNGSSYTIVPTVEVATIAALRLLDPTTAQCAIVLGYYAAGDMFVRVYHYVAGIQNENYGTVIESSVASGTWLLSVGGSDVMDVRIFGMFPNSGIDITENLYDLMNVYYGSGLPTMYFPNGAYLFHGNNTFTFNFPVKFDDCTFINSTSGQTTTFLFTEKATIGFTHAFTDSSSAGLVTPSISSKYEMTVYPEWWGLKGDGSTDNGSLLYLMLSNISRLCTIAWTSTNTYHINTLSTTAKIRAKQIFGQTSLVLDGGLAHNLFILNEISCNKVNPVFQGNYGVLRFKNYAVRASYFCDPSHSGSTVDLSSVITTIAPNIAYGTSFLFDMATCLFSSALSSSNASRFLFSIEDGALLSCSNPYSYTMSLPYFNLNDTYAFLTGGFSTNNTRYINFMPILNTGTVMFDAWIAAIFSACSGDGFLDLCQYSIPLTGSASLIGNLNISNGSLNVSSGSNPIFDCTNLAHILILDDLNVSIPTSSALVNAAYGLDKILIRNSIIDYQYWFGDQYLITHTDPISLFVLDGSYLNVFNIQQPTYSPSVLISSFAATDSTIIANFTSIGQTRVSNCKIGQANNFAPSWTVNGIKSVIINDILNDMNITVRNNGALIGFMFQNNQVLMSDSVRTAITFETDTVDTIHQSTIIVANSWFGELTSSFTAIQQATSGSGTWAGKSSAGIASNPHTINISSNKSDNDFLVIPVTRGFVQNCVGYCVIYENDPVHPTEITWLLDQTAIIQDGLFWIVNSFDDSINDLHGSSAIDYATTVQNRLSAFISAVSVAAGSSSSYPPFAYGVLLLESLSKIADEEYLHKINLSVDLY